MRALTVRTPACFLTCVASIALLAAPLGADPDPTTTNRGPVPQLQQQPDRVAPAPAAPAAPADAEPAATGIDFLHSLAEGMAKAGADGKRLLIVFSTSWCGPCKALQRDVWSNPAVAERVAQDFVAVKLDGDIATEEKQRFGVRGYPTVVIAEADGSVICTQVGTGPIRTAEQAIEWFDLQVNAAGQLGTLESQAAEETTGGNATRELADLYFELGRIAEASELYAKLAADLEEQLFEVKLRQLEIQVRTMRDSAELRGLAATVIPTLIEQADERVISVVISYANIISRLSTEATPLEGRALLLDAAAAFPDHERNGDLRTRAIMSAHLAGEDEVALAEARAFIEEFKDSDDEIEQTMVSRCERFISRLEAGGDWRSTVRPDRGR